MDEADRILDMDFEVEVEKILKVIPKKRRTYLYSATMTKKVCYLLFGSPSFKLELKASCAHGEMVLTLYITPIN